MGRGGAAVVWMDDAVREGAEEEDHVVECAIVLEVPCAEVEKVGGEGGRGGHSRGRSGFSLRKERRGESFEERAQL